MKVRELIEELEDMNPEWDVVVQINEQGPDYIIHSTAILLESDGSEWAMLKGST